MATGIVTDDCTENCPENDSITDSIADDSETPLKRKYISSVSSVSDQDNSTIAQEKPKSKAPKPKKTKTLPERQILTKDKKAVEIKSFKGITMSKDNIATQLQQINKKLENVMQKDDKSLSMKIEQVVEKMRESLEKRIEILECKLFDKEVENDKLKKDIEKLTTELAQERESKEKLKVENEKCQNAANEKLNHLEQYSRVNNVRISGILDVDENEQPTDTINKVIHILREKVAIELNEADIDTAHRLSKFQVGKNRQIIVKLTRRTSKIKILKERKELRKHKIYVSEDLTKLNQEVYNSIRLKMRDEVQAVWTRDGKIFYKRRDETVHQVTYKQYITWLDLPWPVKDGRR